MNATRPTISIALATYNGARFLPAQLQSLLNQSLAPDEIVVGDDGSTDDTLAILNAFAARTPIPVRVQRNPKRLGFADNFMAVLVRTSGDVVALSDQDDVWHPEKLQRCVEVLTANPTVALVQHRVRVIDADGAPVGSSFPDLGRTRVVPPLALDPWFPAYGLTLVVRRPVVELAVRLSRPESFDLDGRPMNHDMWVAFLARSLFDVAVVNEDLLDYRAHGGSVIGPPPGGFGRRIRARLRFGASDYEAHAHLYASLGRFWTSVADVPGVDGHRARAAADRCRLLEEAAVAAASARRPDRSRVSQVARLVQLAARGSYRPRAGGGLGGLAYLRDVAAAALLMGGGMDAAVELSLLQRIADERRAGHSDDLVAARLQREHVPAPGGAVWTSTLVHHLAYVAGSRPTATDVTDPDVPDATAAD